jgi:NAD(P)-dependent dehydrogenase (short-subunit alcohol dehydrogenase family)
MSTHPAPVTLITGASRGLGRSMALHLAQAGHDLILTYRDRADEAASAVAEVESRGRRAAAFRLDSADVSAFPAFMEQVRATLADWGRDGLNHLVNNAGFGLYAPFADTRESDFDALLNVHFKGPFFLTQSLLLVLVDGGSVLNISTGLTRFSFPGYSAYAAMKGAIETLTHYQARELGARRIRVNVLAPGAIATDFGGGAVRDNPGLNAMIAGQTAMGRVGEADDIGAAVVALLGPGAGWITGQRIEASGGMIL